jgi:hypothetical protein
MQTMILTKDRPALSWERAPHKKKQDRNCQRVLNIWSKPQMGLDTKTYWLTDRQSQCDFDLTWEVRRNRRQKPVVKQ